MSVYLSFWRPQDVFEGSFNKLAAFVSRGEFCHVDVTLCMNVADLKKAMSDVMARKDSRTDMKIGECFFNDPAARGLLAHDEGEIYIAFSALWGMDLSARVLRDTATSVWEHTPMEHDAVEWLKVQDMESEEDVLKLATFCIGSLGMRYNLTGALGSLIQCPITSNGVFCSEFAAKTLNEVADTDISTCLTPNALYEVVRSMQGGISNDHESYDVKEESIESI
jgi:hypothetical protein